MSSKLQFDVCCLSCCGGVIWWTLTKERQAWCYLQVKLCDPCLSALYVPWCEKALCRYSSFPFLSHRSRQPKRHLDRFDQPFLAGLTYRQTTLLVFIFKPNLPIADKLLSGIAVYTLPVITGREHGWCIPSTREHLTDLLYCTFIIRRDGLRAMQIFIMGIYTASQRVPTFKLTVTLSNLNRFSNFSTAGKRMKFATKVIWH